MELELQRVRDCDGQCCKESPRFPNADRSDCIYHTTPNGKESSGCQLMTGEKTLKNDGTRSVAFSDRDHIEIYIETCVNWPQQNSIKQLGDTGGCCWQWVEV